MIRIQLREQILALLIIFSTLPLIGQNDFQKTFNKNIRPSSDNIRVYLTDDLGNDGYLPICIIKGKKQGPVFTILSGVHGFEYPPIIAAQELIQEIDPELLTGTLIIIPIANTSSFFSRTPFVNPKDKINLNRAFPGSATGSITKKIADMITTEIIPVSDVFLDVHGGDANEDLLPFVCYYNNEQNPKETKLARKLSEASGIKYIVKYPYKLKYDKPAKYAFKQAVQNGKTALSIESGKLGNVQEEAVVLIKNGVYNMLNEMKMYIHHIKTNEKPILLNGQAYVKSDKKGVFYSNLKAGDSVKKGEIVGHITDEFGSVISETRASHSGIILYKIGTPPVNVNETLLCIGYSL